MKVVVATDPRTLIRRGIEPATEMVVDIDLAQLTEEDRAMLAEYTHPHNGAYIIIDPVTKMYRLGVADPNPEGVLATLRARVAEAKRRAEQQKDEDERSIQECLSRPLEHWVERVGDEVRVKPPMYLPERLMRDERIRARQQEAERQVLPGVLARIEAERRAREELYRRRQEEAERRKDRLRKWALSSGSQRVRLLLEEAHPAWLPVALDEFFAAHTPEGYSALTDEYEERERTKPTVQDILALREARRLVEASGGVLRNPRMAWLVRYEENEEDEDECEVAEKFSAIVLDVAAPTEDVRSVFRRVQQ